VRGRTKAGGARIQGQEPRHFGPPPRMEAHADPLATRYVPATWNKDTHVYQNPPIEPGCIHPYGLSFLSNWASGEVLVTEVATLHCSGNKSICVRNY
jgi:hypothetical protein